MTTAPQTYAGRPSLRLGRPGWWLLAGSVVCLVILGFRWGLPAYRAAALIQRVEVQLGGRVTSQGDVPEWLHRVAGDTAPRPFQEVVAVDAFRSQFTDADLGGLTQFPALRSLSLGLTNVTDRGLRQVGEMTQLDYVGLRGNDVTDEGLAHLAGLTNLTGLNLAETRVTDAGLVHLRGMTRLRALWLFDTAVTEAGLMQIAELPELSHLFVLADQLSADGYDDLRRRKNGLKQGRPGLQITVHVSEQDGSGFSYRSRVTGEP